CPFAGAGADGSRRRALAHYSESLRLCLEIEEPRTTIYCLQGGAAIVAARGDTPMPRLSRIHTQTGGVLAPTPAGRSRHPRGAMPPSAHGGSVHPSLGRWRRARRRSRRRRMGSRLLGGVSSGSANEPGVEIGAWRRRESSPTLGLRAVVSPRDNGCIP